MVKRWIPELLRHHVIFELFEVGPIAWLDAWTFLKHSSHAVSVEEVNIWPKRIIVWKTHQRLAKVDHLPDDVAAELS